MTKAEFGLSHHEIKLQLELFRRTGKSFQDFFEEIMQKVDPSFLMIKPMGREGDWKADGYSLNGQTIYQCYAPEDMSGSEAAKKVCEDFEGAKSRWQHMKRWVFVWSSERALPPQVAGSLANLKSAHPELEIDHIGRAGLWEIVKGLPLSARESLLGIVPDPNDAPTMTAVEIQVLMNHLGGHHSLMSNTADFDLTAIAEKLQRNHLSEAVTNIVKPSIPVAKLVGEFVTSMPEPSFSQAIAAALGEKYIELAASAADPDVIFGGITEYVQGGRRPEPKFFWAAAGIVTYYFELCDIFER